VDPDTFPENRYPNGKLKPHGQKKKCDAGMDFAEVCPIGWTYVSSGQFGPECQAPANFYTESGWCRQQLGPRQALAASLDQWKKKEIYDECWVLWPCRDLKHDFRKPCPQGWTWEKDGLCSAPYFYSGTCPFKMNLLNYTQGMKATFAANCNAQWPLASRYMNKPQPTPARYPSHAPGQPPAWQCTRNFNRTCPDGFNFDGAMCHEDGSYINPSMTNCAHFDARRWTNQMKEAFGEHCHVWWPCKASQRSGTQNLRNGPVEAALLLLEPPTQKRKDAQFADFL